MTLKLINNEILKQKNSIIYHENSILRSKKHIENYEKIFIPNLLEIHKIYPKARYLSMFNYKELEIDFKYIKDLKGFNVKIINSYEPKICLYKNLKVNNEKIKIYISKENRLEQNISRFNYSKSIAFDNLILFEKPCYFDKMTKSQQKKIKRAFIKWYINIDIHEFKLDKNSLDDDMKKLLVFQ